MKTIRNSLLCGIICLVGGKCLSQNAVIEDNPLLAFNIKATDSSPPFAGDKATVALELTHFNLSTTYQLTSWAIKKGGQILPWTLQDANANNVNKDYCLSTAETTFTLQIPQQETGEFQVSFTLKALQNEHEQEQTETYTFSVLPRPKVTTRKENNPAFPSLAGTVSVNLDNGSYQGLMIQNLKIDKENTDCTNKFTIKIDDAIFNTTAGHTLKGFTTRIQFTPKQGTSLSSDVGYSLSFDVYCGSKKLTEQPITTDFRVVAPEKLSIQLSLDPSRGTFKVGEKVAAKVAILASKAAKKEYYIGYITITEHDKGNIDPQTCKKSLGIALAQFTGTTNGVFDQDGKKEITFTPTVLAHGKSYTLAIRVEHPKDTQDNCTVTQAFSFPEIKLSLQTKANIAKTHSIGKIQVNVDNVVDDNTCKELMIKDLQIVHSKSKENHTQHFSINVDGKDLYTVDPDPAPINHLSGQATPIFLAINHNHSAKVPVGTYNLSCNVAYYDADYNINQESLSVPFQVIDNQEKTAKEISNLVFDTGKKLSKAKEIIGNAITGKITIQQKIDGLASFICVSLREKNIVGLSKKGEKVVEAFNQLVLAAKKQLEDAGDILKKERRQNSKKIIEKISKKISEKTKQQLQDIKRELTKLEQQYNEQLNKLNASKTS